MNRRGVGYFVMALLVAVSVATKVYYDKNERIRQETIEMQRSSAHANLQPELSPPPPDEMWAKKSPTPSRRGMQMMQRPAPNTTSPGSGSGTAPATSPSPSTSNSNPGNSSVQPLLRDREQLQRQLWQLDPAQIDQQIAQRSQDLTQLHAQMNQYTSALQNLEQQTTQTAQFHQVLQETAINELDGRIRIQERLLQSTREQQAQYQLNPVLFDPTTGTLLQNQLIAQEQQLQSLMAQRAAVPAESMREMQGLGQQALTNRASLESARVAVQTQIRFIEQDLSRLTQEKTNNELLRAQYQRELNLVENQLRASGVTQQTLPTLNFP